jgi:toxin ParE1/3/4
VSALPTAVVASFRLSARAKDELVAIYDDSEARFGSYQADAYLAGLERTFGLLADFPGIGQAVDYLKVGFRRFRFQAHIVFYIEDRDGVLIRAVVHEARDIRPELFG